MSERAAMTEEQFAAIQNVKPDSIWKIPDGSYLFVRNAEPGKTQFLAVVEPGARLAWAWDFGDEGV